eukprot:12796160-Alexandrium_andersonii.AAC.1
MRARPLLPSPRSAASLPQSSRPRGPLRARGQALPLLRLRGSSPANRPPHRSLGRCAATTGPAT